MTDKLAYCRVFRYNTRKYYRRSGDWALWSDMPDTYVGQGKKSNYNLSINIKHKKVLRNLQTGTERTSFTCLGYKYIYILLPKMTLFRVKNSTLQLPNLGQLPLFLRLPKVICVVCGIQGFDMASLQQRVGNEAI